MAYRIYVDGQEGTTGLKIFDRLANRPELEIMKIDPDKRKDNAERKKFLDAADVVFLCLPDAASIEAMTLLGNPETRVLDTSTAFRISPDWVYGIPELSADSRKAVTNAKRVAVPGCHATGFIMLVAPLVAAGIIPADAALSCTSLTGFTGGGKKMIAEYNENRYKEDRLSYARPYALTLAHKHLPEMQVRSGLRYKPVFLPVLADVAQGMIVTVPLHSSAVGGRNGKDLHAALTAHYAGQRFVRVMPYADDSVLDAGSIRMNACNGSNRIDLFVFGNDEGRILLASRFDNLGKGASGAAVQCMNLMLGLPEEAGLST
jgi:N-acetyl-gamma-glutamyl-phosphate reductase